MKDDKHDEPLSARNLVPCTKSVSCSKNKLITGAPNGWFQ